MSQIRFSVSTAALLAGLSTAALADTTLLSEDWTGRDQAYLESEWSVPLGPANQPRAFIEDASDQISVDTWGLETFDDSGTAVSHFGSDVATWNGLSSANGISPTATQSILLQADLYDDLGVNKRMSIGLRGDTAPLGIIELGVWNSAPADGLAHRAILFDPEVGANPNWQTWEFAAGLDRADDDDELVNRGDIGAGWHTYSALIEDDSITFEIDLFRDGLVNTRDEVTGEIIGTTPGVDATVTYDITQVDPSATTFTSLRIGGPSNSTSGGDFENGLLYDNILLQLVDVVSEGLVGDYDEDGQVAQGDLNLVLNNWGAARTFEDPGGTVFSSANVDQEELNGVLNNWGAQAAPSFEGSAVPEPASLAALGGLALLGLRRRK
ncbi:MAG: PEP-CTERM sorting domain-containing protein [Planctomycetota bacterium]